jgi:hypothetical protein
VLFDVKNPMEDGAPLPPRTADSSAGWERDRLRTDRIDLAGVVVDLQSIARWCATCCALELEPPRRCPLRRVDERGGQGIGCFGSQRHGRNASKGNKAHGRTGAFVPGNRTKDYGRVDGAKPRRRTLRAGPLRRTCRAVRPSTRSVGNGRSGRGKRPCEDRAVSRDRDGTLHETRPSARSRASTVASANVGDGPCGGPDLRGLGAGRDTRVVSDRRP